MCGGKQVEVGVDLVASAHPGSSATVFAAHQMPQLSFHLRAGGPVVRDPVRVLLLLPGIGQALLVPTHGDRASVAGSGALRAQRAPGADVAEVGDAVAFGAAPDRRGLPGRACDDVTVQVDAELVFGEPASRCGRRLGLAPRGDVVACQGLVELTAAVGRVAVDDRPEVCGVAPIALAAVDQVIDEVGGDLGVTDVAGADFGVGDDLAVRIDRDMSFVAVEPAGLRLVTVPGLRVDGGDDPVLRDPPGDRNTPSSPVSRSWPSTVASSTAASVTSAARSARPSSSASNA